MKSIGRIAILLCACAWVACSSGGSSPANPDKAKAGGFRVLEAVVVEREMEAGYAGAMTYTMGFEAQDGEATSHFRYPVTREQYNRYPEGTHVRLYMADDRLRDIKSATEK